MGFSKVLLILFFPLALLFLVFPAQGALGQQDLNKTAIYKIYQNFMRKFLDVKDIHALRAMAQDNSGDALFVDVRPDAERRVSRIPGAVDREVFEKDPGKYGNKNIIAYCTFGYRSAQWARQMNRSGIPAKNLAAGLLAWVWEGGDLTNGDNPTRRVHVYGKKYNFLPPGYEAVW